MTKFDYAKILDQLEMQVGGLIEIYVLDANFQDWSRALSGLRSEGYGVSVVDLETNAPIEFGQHVFKDDGDVGCILTVRLRSQVWTSGIHSANLIDLQGDPREVISSRDLADVVQLMNCIHASTGKRVVLVAETLDRAIKPYLVVP